MEDTLGKRIVAHRKRIGLTQDALADQLGVTAQAVSKWENDQSCPDITMLPKLAEIFDCTTDMLFGITSQALPPAAVPDTCSDHPADILPESKNALWELQWDWGRMTGIGIALWLLLSGSLAMASAILHWGLDTWHILWRSGLLVWGLFGMLRKFSALYMGLFLFGGYFLLGHLSLLPESLRILKWEVVLSGTLLLLGSCTLVDSLCRSRKSAFHIKRNGAELGQLATHCTYNGETFDCGVSFGDQRQMITMSRLSAGTVSCSFGEMVLDLSGCGEIADGCTLKLSCSFGDLELLVPKHCRIEPDIGTSFASYETQGHPASDAGIRIYVNGSVNFGNITFRYF